MKFVSEKSPWPRLLVFPLLTVALATLLALRFFPDQVFHLAHCPLRETLSLPCLTCGGTHSLFALVQGHWLESLTANPLVFFGTLVFILWSLYALASTLLPHWRFTPVFGTHEKKAIRWGMALILLANWGYEIWRFSA